MQEDTMQEDTMQEDTMQEDSSESANRTGSGSGERRNGRAVDCVDLESRFSFS
jgi:hypothetical protein